MDKTRNTAVLLGVTDLKTDVKTRKKDQRLIVHLYVDLSNVLDIAELELLRH